MLNFKKIYGLGVALAILAANGLSALEPCNDVSLSAGWRGESFHSRANYTQFVPKDGEKPASRPPFGYETVKIKDLNFWRLGGKFHIAFPEGCCDDCDGELWWLTQLYSRGHFYYGWAGTQGKYSETRNIAPDGTFNIPNTPPIKAKLHKGHSVDGTIALGFLYPICEEWGIGPVGGWAYDRFSVSAKDEGDLAGMKFTNTFQGPFIGADFLYYMCECDVTVYAGYEFHWARWHATRQLAKADLNSCTFFSDSRRGNDGYGHRVWIDGRWTWCECWDLGVGFEYNYFYDNSGRLKAKNGSLIDVGCRATSKVYVRKADWHAYGVTLDLGYRF